MWNKNYFKNLKINNWFTKESLIPLLSSLLISICGYLFNFFFYKDVKFREKCNYRYYDSVLNFSVDCDTCLNCTINSEMDISDLEKLLNDDFNNINIFTHVIIFVTLFFFFTFDSIFVKPIQLLYKKNKNTSLSKNDVIERILDALVRNNFTLILITHTMMIFYFFYLVLRFIYSNYSINNSKKNHNDILKNFKNSNYSLNKQQHKNQNYTSKRSVNDNVDFLYDVYCNLNVKCIFKFFSSKTYSVYDKLIDKLSNSGYSENLNNLWNFLLNNIYKFFNNVKNFKICQLNIFNDFFLCLELSNSSLFFFYYKIFIILYLILYYTIIELLNIFLDLKKKINEKKNTNIELIKLVVMYVSILVLFVFSIITFTKDDWILCVLFSFFYISFYVIFKILHKILEYATKLYCFIADCCFDLDDIVIIVGIITTTITLNFMFYTHCFSYIYFPIHLILSVAIALVLIFKILFFKYK